MNILEKYKKDGYDVFDTVNDGLNKILFKNNEDVLIFNTSEENFKFINKKDLLNYTKDYIKYLSRKNPKIAEVLLKNIPTTNWPQLTLFFNRIIKNKNLFNKEINRFLDKRNEFIKIFESTNKDKKNKLINLLEIKSIDSKNLLQFVDINNSINENDLKKAIIGFNKIIKSKSIIEILSNFKMEEIEDYMDILEKNHEYDLIVKNELTNNNKKLWNKECFDLLKELVGKDFNAKNFNEKFGKKIKKYKSSHDLLRGLNQLSDILSGWNVDFYKEKFKKYNVKYEEIEENKFIAEIENYKQSEALGTTLWCISTSDYYFEQYKKTDLYRQLFYYDFNKEPNDNLSMIGITLNEKENISAAHNKSDISIRYLPEVERIVSKVSKLTNEEKYEIIIKKYKNIDLNRMSSNEIKKVRNRVDFNISKEYGLKFENTILSQLSDPDKISFLLTIGGRNSDNMKKIKKKIACNIKNSKNPKNEFNLIYDNLKGDRKNFFDFMINWAKEDDLIGFLEIKDLYKNIIKHGSNMDLIIDKWDSIDEELKLKIGSHLIQTTSYYDNTKKKRNKRLYEDLGSLIIHDNLDNTLKYIKENNKDLYKQCKEAIYVEIAINNIKHNYLENKNIVSAINQIDFYSNTLGNFNNKIYNLDNLKKYLPNELQTDLCIYMLSKRYVCNFDQLDPSIIDWKTVFSKSDKKSSNIRAIVNLIEKDEKWNNKKLIKHLLPILNEYHKDDKLYKKFIKKYELKTNLKV